MQLGRWARAVGLGDLIGLSRRATPAGRVHFPQAERHDRFSGGQKAARKVSGRLAALTVTARLSRSALGTEEPPPRSPWMFRLAETGQPCLPTASLDGLGWARRHRVGGESVGPPPDPS